MDGGIYVKHVVSSTLIGTAGRLR